MSGSGPAAVGDAVASGAELSVTRSVARDELTSEGRFEARGPARCFASVD